MTPDKELKKAVEEMRRGSKAGFVQFFNKTFQFTCLWTARIMSDTIRRDDFLSEFYPYALLHISDLEDSEQVFSWLEKLLPVFYELWSGQAYGDVVRPLHPVLPDNSEILSAATIVWSLINKKVSFPETKKPPSIPFPLVLAAFISAAVILVCILVYQRNHIETMDHAMIDDINAENRAFSTNSELDEYLQNTHVDETENVTVTVEEIIHEPATE